MYGIKHKGKILPLTISESGELAETKFKEVMDKTIERIGERVNQLTEALDTRHDHVCDLTKQSIKGQKNG